MKPTKILVLAASAVLAYLPTHAGAFGLGMSSFEYPPGPWGPYAPYPPLPRQAAGSQDRSPQAGLPYPPYFYGLPPLRAEHQGNVGQWPGNELGTQTQAAVAEATRVALYEGLGLYEPL